MNEKEPDQKRLRGSFSFPGDRPSMPLDGFDSETLYEQPPEMTLDEKVRLVALYGDISEFNRGRWFKFEAAPGLVEILAGIDEKIGHLNDGRLLLRKKRPT